MFLLDLFHDIFIINVHEISSKIVFCYTEMQFIFAYWSHITPLCWSITMSNSFFFFFVKKLFAKQDSFISHFPNFMALIYFSCIFALDRIWSTKLIKVVTLAFFSCSRFKGIGFKLVLP